MIWTMIEVSLSLILVSLPALDFILVKLIPDRLLEKLRKQDEDPKSVSNGALSTKPLTKAQMEFANTLVPPIGKSMAIVGHSDGSYDEESFGEQMRSSSRPYSSTQSKNHRISSSWLSTSSE